jgi:hypothetical protein
MITATQTSDRNPFECLKDSKFTLPLKFERGFEVATEGGREYIKECARDQEVELDFNK